MQTSACCACPLPRRSSAGRCRQGRLTARPELDSKTMARNPALPFVREGELVEYEWSPNAPLRLTRPCRGPRSLPLQGPFNLATTALATNASRSARVLFPFVVEAVRRDATTSDGRCLAGGPPRSAPRRCRISRRAGQQRLVGPGNWRSRRQCRATMTIDTDPLGGEAAGRSRLVLRQGAWAIADQLLSSGTNFVMAVMVARLLAPKAYGSFVLATSAWLTLLSVVRAAVIHPFVVEAAQQDEAIFRQAASEASGVVVAVGVLGAALLAGVGVALGARTESGQAFVILGILTPFLVLQDFWRFTAFARGRARTAVANDGVWALVQTVCILLLIEASTRSPAAAVAAWGTGAVAGAFLG